MAAPYKPQDHDQVKALIAVLAQAADRKSAKENKPRFHVTHRDFSLPTGRSIDRWKIGEYDYHKPNLPVYARGLFTYKTQDGHDEIAVRGYDKFFNLGESEVKNWPDVGTKTVGPYELSVKENGCIIFLAGLDDGTLLVCSKHSTGSNSNVTTASELSHSLWGEKWVERHLAVAGKTREMLARELRRMNATAVAELCDDEFEEHVLPYSGDRAGLYIHGININVPEFITYPGPLVDKFADEWGFKKVDYVLKETLAEVETFLTHAAETGTYDGRDTEGFVVRCQRRIPDSDETKDFFFKFKFEEPYLLYRQWREMTRAIIRGDMPKIDKNKDITRKYLEYAARRLDTEPELKEAYRMSQGIIRLRQDFFEANRLTGMDVVRHEREDTAAEDEGKDGPAKRARTLAPKVVIVPVATVGCGKTTLALALSRLFGWGVVQNDDVTAKKNRFHYFAAQIRSTFAEKETSVVIADRNNHMAREREQIINQMPPYPGAYSFICLHYVHRPADRAAIMAETRTRIVARGNNHQTIHAVSNERMIGSIIGGFINRFEPVDPMKKPDSEFSLIVELNPLDESRVNLETAITKMFAAYPSLFPDGVPQAGAMDDAIRWARHEYVPAILKAAPRQAPAGPKPKIEYFAVRVSATDIVGLLKRAFDGADPATRAVYDALVDTERVQSEFHVTLIHKAASTKPQNVALWRALVSLHRTVSASVDGANTEPELGKARVLVERIVWNDRLMCLVVRLLETAGSSAPFLDDQRLRSVNRVAHITIGTMKPSIKPKESNDLLARWLDEEEEPVEEPQSGSGSGSESEPEVPAGTRRELVLDGEVVLEGSVRGVLSLF